MITGFPHVDAAADFARERRRQSLAALVSHVRTRRADGRPMVALASALGAPWRVIQRDLGVQAIDLTSIVGTVDRRSDDFDRRFRPRTRRVGQRWQQIAAARRRGEAMPPIDVYRVGDRHFVVDGHHRVSVARALGDATIDARVRIIQADPR